MQRTLSKIARHLVQLCGRKPSATPVDMTGRHVIVTGASPNSLGFETARILASWGATVVATCVRNVPLMESSLKEELRKIGASGNNITAHRLDLCDPESVNGFAAWYRENHRDKLHVLVNNAGIHRKTFTPRKEPLSADDGSELHWRTNYLGAFHLTWALLPLLKRSGLESGDARVVNVSSGLHDRVGNESLFSDMPLYHSWDAYGLSKLAMIHMACEIERRFGESFNLHAVALHPGAVMTNLTLPQAFHGRLGKAAHRIGSSLTSLVLLSPNAGAQTIVMCASTKSLKGGKYYERCDIVEPSVGSQDEVAAERLWVQSERWVRTLPETVADVHWPTQDPKQSHPDVGRLI